MKKAVIYGAGNIGRGFIGQLLYESDYHTVFIDVNSDTVCSLNERRAYPLRILAGNNHAGMNITDIHITDMTIKNVSAVHGRDTEQAAAAIAEAGLMATAVGAGVLPEIAPVIAAGLCQRYKRGGAPLDILVCENLKDCGNVLRGLICEHMPKELEKWYMNYIGLVETSIGRMVPLQTPELLDGDPLRVCVEAYSTLPVDRGAFRAGIPDLRGMLPCEPFSFYIERKLYIHNMGHALAAYCGDYLGFEYLWQPVEVPGVKALVRKAMLACAMALARKYGADKEELHAHVEDLLQRFANRQLGDTVYRVGRDLRRKLAAEDRMIGALRICAEADTGGILLGIALALRFSHSDLNMPAEQALTEICEIYPDEPAYASILGMYKHARSGASFYDLVKGVA